MAGNIGIDHHGNVIAVSSQKMEKTIKIWQAIMALVGIVLTVGTMIINQSNKIETLRIQMEIVMNDAKDKSLLIRDLNQQMNLTYKEINAKLTDIQIMLQNKENKK